MRKKKIEDENILKVLGRTRKHKYDVEFEDFMSMNCKCVELIVTKDDYKDIHSAYNSIHRSLQDRKNLYPISVHLRKGKLYLMRTDMD